jgi:hypothetical protein
MSTDRQTAAILRRVLDRKRRKRRAGRRTTEAKDQPQPADRPQTECEDGRPESDGRSLG